jgi:hypothetical protein
VLAVLALAVAGCSEPEQPSTSLPTAVSTSAEPTLEPLGPADFPVPAEAREQTEAGATAMATYYLDLLDYMKAEVEGGSLDTGPLRALSQDCETCDQVADGFDNASAEGYAYEGGDLAAPAFGSVALTPPTADVVFTVTQSAARVLRTDGSEVRTSAETTLRGGIVLRWDGARTVWIADQLNLTN